VSRRALIVIDVQNEYFDGALPITSPPPESSIANIRRAMDAATAAGVPVIVVRHVDADPEAEIFRAGTPAIDLHEEVAERPRDHDVEKHMPGSFTGTPLGEILDAAGVDTLSVTGYMTHMCVDTTARQAVHRGMAVEILDDATGTLALDNAGGKVSGEELHRAILAAQAHGLSEVISTDEWLRRLAGSTSG
jgi:nicotinamidase-related amidase